LLRYPWHYDEGVSLYAGVQFPELFPASDGGLPPNKHIHLHRLRKNGWPV
jgi:hypothetical protein